MAMDWSSFFPNLLSGILIVLCGTGSAWFVSHRFQVRKYKIEKKDSLITLVNNTHRKWMDLYTSVQGIAHYYTNIVPKGINIQHPKTEEVFQEDSRTYSISWKEYVSSLNLLFHKIKLQMKLSDENEIKLDKFDTFNENIICNIDKEYVFNVPEEIVQERMKKLGEIEDKLFEITKIIRNSEVQVRLK